LSRIATLQRLVNILDLRYEENPKPIDADFYHMVRNIAKYIIEKEAIEDIDTAFRNIHKYKCDFSLDGCVSCGKPAIFKATAVSSKFPRYVCEEHVQKRITRNIVEPWLIERLDEEGNPVDLIKET